MTNETRYRRRREKIGRDILKLDPSNLLDKITLKHKRRELKDVFHLEFTEAKKRHGA